MEWSNTAPTVSGIYWLKVDGQLPQIVEVSGWDASKPEYIYYMGPMTGTTQLDADELKSAKWFGPMDAPSEE